MGESYRKFPNFSVTAFWRAGTAITLTIGLLIVFPKSAILPFTSEKGANSTDAMRWVCGRSPPAAMATHAAIPTLAHTICLIICFPFWFS